MTRHLCALVCPQVFRMIDRADYMIFGDDKDERLEAYEDHAWRRGTLHLSAPCIYTRALEALRLDKGMLALLRHKQSTLHYKGVKYGSCFNDVRIDMDKLPDVWQLWHSSTCCSGVLSCGILPSRLIRWKFCFH